MSYNICGTKLVLYADILMCSICFSFFQSFKLEEKNQYLKLLQKFTDVPLQAQNRHPRSVWNTRYILCLFKLKCIRFLFYVISGIVYCNETFP
jgi:hypothetical protein